MSSKESNRKLNILKNILNLYAGIGISLWLLALVFIFTPALPYLWYSINADASQQELASIAEPTLANSNVAFIDKIDNTPSQEPVNTVKLPPYNETLSESNMLYINNIGVIAEIHEAEIAEQGLEKGVWRVYDYGTPEDNIPIILASHRFGYIHWSRDFRDKNSFYNLPKTRIGDRIIIIWNQRQYEYEIYKEEEGTTINDYQADLIIYTCKMFNSPIRVFRYAKRIN